MKVSFEIPDFPGIEKRALFVFLGMDMVAMKYPDGPWEVKTGYCSQCGKCCQNLGPDRTFPPVKDGACEMVETKGNHVRCGLGVFRPFKCAISNPGTPGCTVKFEPGE